MLWHRPYETKILGQVSIPNLPFQGRGALAGCPDRRGFRELEIWRLLFEAELSLPYFLGCSDLDSLRSVNPPSRQDILRKLDKDWIPIVGEATVFALIGEGHQAEILMLGAPTEDAWEMFLTLAQSNKTG